MNLAGHIGSLINSVPRIFNLMTIIISRYSVTFFAIQKVTPFISLLIFLKKEGWNFLGSERNRRTINLKCSRQSLLLFENKNILNKIRKHKFLNVLINIKKIKKVGKDNIEQILIMYYRYIFLFKASSGPKSDPVFTIFKTLSLSLLKSYNRIILIRVFAND